MYTHDFLDTTDRMVQGYEGWLAPRVTHVHEGDNLDIFLFSGHNMNPDRLMRNEELFVYAIDPEGKKQGLELIGNTEEHYIYRIKVEKKGLYHFVSQKTGCYCKDAEGKRLNGTLKDNPDAVMATRYLQYAHTVLPVGHDLMPNEYTEVPLLPLRIVPESWNTFKTGENLVFTLYFNERSLPLYDIDLAYNPGDGETTHEELITDSEGRITYSIKDPGKYLILAQYLALEWEENLYFDTIYTYTFWFKVKR